MRTAIAFFGIIVFIAILSSTAAAERDVVRISSEGVSGPRLVAYFDPSLTERTVCVSAGDTVVA